MVWLTDRFGPDSQALLLGQSSSWDSFYEKVSYRVQLTWLLLIARCLGRQISQPGSPNLGQPMADLEHCHMPAWIKLTYTPNIRP